jgi:hypothetical protein
MRKRWQPDAEKEKVRKRNALLTMAKILKKDAEEAEDTARRLRQDAEEAERKAG